MRARSILNGQRVELKDIAQQLELIRRRRFQIEPEQMLFVREQRRQRRRILTMNSILTLLTHNREHGNPITSLAEDTSEDVRFTSSRTNSSESLRRLSAWR